MKYMTDDFWKGWALMEQERRRECECTNDEQRNGWRHAFDQQLTGYRTGEWWELVRQNVARVTGVQWGQYGTTGVTE